MDCLVFVLLVLIRIEIRSRVPSDFLHKGHLEDRPLVPELRQREVSVNQTNHFCHVFAHRDVSEFAVLSQKKGTSWHCWIVFVRINYLTGSSFTNF